MLEPTYRVSGVISHGTSGCQAAAVAKRSDPYTLANEFICARLASAVGVVVPPGGLGVDGEGNCTYVMLDFAPADVVPLVVEPKAVVEQKPHAAAGIVAFDCWVRNDDRHRESVFLHPETGALVAFDHGDALFGSEGRTRLNSPDVEFRGGELDPYLLDARDLALWAERIASVSLGLIREICEEPVRRSMVEPADAIAAARFLNDRKSLILARLKSDSVCGCVCW